MSRSARSFLNLLTGIATSVVTMLVSLIATRLLLKWLGQERLGAFRASSDWSGYLGLMELGLGGALLPMLADAMGRADQHHHARGVLAIAFRAYRYVALAMLIPGALLVVFIPNLLRAGPAIAGDLRFGFAIGLLTIAFVPLSPLRPLLESTQRSYIVNAALLAQSLVITAVSLLLAYFRYGITGQWVAIVVGGAIFNAALIFNTWRRVPNMRRLILWPSEPVFVPLPSSQGVTPADVTRIDYVPPASSDPRARLWQLNWPTLVLNVTGRVGLATDSVMLALFLGPALVVPFQLTQRLAQTAQSQLQNVGNSTWAALAELYAKGEHDLFVRRLMDLTRLTVILGFSVMGPIIAFDDNFVTRWVGAGQYGGLTLNILSGANGLAQAIFSLWGWVFAGTGKVPKLVPLFLTSGIFNISASAICTKSIGITGPLWGTLAAFVLINSWWMPLLLRREFKVPLRSIFSAIAAPLALGLPYAAILSAITHRWPPHMWVTIAVGMAASALGYLALAWCVILSPEERAVWTERFMKFRGANRPVPTPS